MHRDDFDFDEKDDAEDKPVDSSSSHNDVQH